ncbi:NAD(P)H-dependent flavin oxidoreductase [Sneathiella chinensis]|uniref:2-nitropropane dioxygenase n=1 Tax=Sneathiella chinensis TaxID=349750 RepID=A0ABQ5U892_9PROT|nr:nitronate monooxygenase [Sneathiella chinensis]GLQ07903.1 2-nitropropane dioxygenase [Sneathiella chinensis]
MTKTRNSVCTLLDIEHPILLAPMAGVSGGALAAAVSTAGGLGLIGGGYAMDDWVMQEVPAAGNTRTGIGFITWRLAQNPALLDRVLAHNPVAVMLSFGDPAPFVPAIRKSGAKIICQVQTVAHARHAAKAGADILVAQGSEAGGHGGSRGLFSLLPAIRDALPDIPVLAAGGLTDNADLQAAAALGASGALIGTRFFASPEALGHPHAKQALIDNGGDDTLRTTVFDVARDLDWPAPYTVRAIRNDFTRKWHGNEASLDAEKADVVAGYTQSVQHGDTRIMGVFAGEGLDRIHSIKPTADIFKSLVSTPVNWAR